MKNGNSGSGAAAADVEIATVPIASAAKAAASFDDLNIGRPLKFAPCRASFSASLGKPVQVNRFGSFARNRQNGFVALGNCFIKTSLPGTGRPGRIPKVRGSNSQIIAETTEKPRLLNVSFGGRASAARRARRRR
jgi:hypothetical protein